MSFPKIPGQIYIILACLCYSCEWWFITNLHSLGLYSYEITFFKSFFACIFLSAFFFFYQKSTIWKMPILSKKEIMLLLGFGVLFLGANLLYMWALVETKIMNVLILSYMTIFIAPLAGIFFLWDKLKKHILPLLFLAFLWIILTLYIENGIGITFWIWELMALGVAVTITGTMIIVKKTPHINPWFRIFIAYTFCTIILWIYIVFSWRLFYIFSSLYIVILGTILWILTGILGRWLKDIGTNMLPIHTTIVILLLEPLLQIATSALFSGQYISNINYIGAMIVIISMFLVNSELFNKKYVPPESI